MIDVSPTPAGLDRVRFVATDMDHSLLLEDSTLPEGLSERVEALARVGVEFAIASGRPLYTIRDFMGELAPKITIIADNGAVVAHRGEVVYQADLPVADYRRMARDTKRLGGVSCVCALDACYYEHGSEPYDDFFGKFYTRRHYVDDLTELDLPADKFTIYFPDLDSHEKAAPFLAAIGDGFSASVTDRMWLDVTPLGVSKGAAMHRVSEILGVDLADMVAFGDERNDCDMLETVGFGYLMANAAPYMLPHADFIAPSNEDLGVLKVIDQIVAARS